MKKIKNQHNNNYDRTCVCRRIMPMWLEIGGYHLRNVDCRFHYEQTSDIKYGLQL